MARKNKLSLPLGTGTEERDNINGMDAIDGCVVALVGRPNVGKSTLFNRLSTRKKAIVHDYAGVTRDRKYSPASLGGISFTVVDTPGLENSDEAALQRRMLGQAFLAISSSDVICLMVDGVCGITPEDIFFANMIREVHDNVIVVVNKCERDAPIENDYYKLGFKEVVRVSAEHGLGMSELYVALVDSFAEIHKDMADNNLTYTALNESVDSVVSDPTKKDQRPINMTIVGRPNAGKSTFVNALLGYERVLTGPEAGITRDSIEIKWKWEGRKFNLVDTAGMRKRTNISQSLEKMSVGDTIHSIKFADIVVLMIDATEGLLQQDINIAGFVIQEGRGIIIAINKWDLIPINQRKRYQSDLEYRLENALGDVRGISVVYVSALRNENISTILSESINIYDIWNRKISTSQLNQWLGFAAEEHQLPLHRGTRVRLKYITQTHIRPPTLKIFTNHPDKITQSYEKYLINSFRDAFGIHGVPVRIRWQKSDNPYAGKKK